jgi:hypothetical protein
MNKNVIYYPITTRTETQTDFVKLVSVFSHLWSAAWHNWLLLANMRESA